MKKTFVAVLAACMLTTVPLMAAEHMGKSQPMDQKAKDECLLYAKKCSTQVDTIQQKIRKLDNEIKKGTRVYSPEELKRLDAKLKEANDLLDRLGVH